MMPSFTYDPLSALNASMINFGALSNLGIPKMTTGTPVSALLEALRIKWPDLSPAFSTSVVQSFNHISPLLDTIGSQSVALNGLLATKDLGIGRLASQAHQVVSAQSAVKTVLSGLDIQPYNISLLNTVARYGEIQASLGHLTLLGTQLSALFRQSAPSSRRYDTYLRGLPRSPSVRRARVAQEAGDAQSGLLVAERLMTPSLGDDVREQLVAEFSEIAAPWLAGPVAARSQLFEALAALEPDLDGWLKAAWDDLERDGAKAASKVAHCAMECIDRSLRAAGPRSDVLSWIHSNGNKTSHLHDGEPTRSGRIAYIMRSRSARDVALADGQVEFLIGQLQLLTKNFQSVKHSDAARITVVRSWVITTESVLSQLFIC